MLLSTAIKMNEIKLEDYVVAEEVTTPYLVESAQQNYEKTMASMYAEANERAKTGKHPFTQLEQFNACAWPSAARIECFFGKVAANRTQKMPFADVERDINFNLMSVWALANDLLPNKVFFTTEVSFDHEAALWTVNIMLNITEGTGLTDEELEIKLVRIITTTRVTRHY
jgi:hypothetical protein